MGRAIETKPSRRRGRFRRLVEDFEATLREQNVAMPTADIERFLANRITVVAATIGASEQYALSTYFPDTWGSDMARRVIEDRAGERARRYLADDATVSAPLVARLIAALGQAQLFAATNADADTPDNSAYELDDERAQVAAAWTQSMPSTEPHYDPAEAANATSGLGLALHDALTDDADLGRVGAVAVPGHVLLGCRRTLEAFEDRLRRGRWVSCRCSDCTAGGDDRIDPVSVHVADQVAADRAALAKETSEVAPAACERDADVAVSEPARVSSLGARRSARSARSASSDAASSARGSSAVDLSDQVAALLRSRGWPVVVEDTAQFGEWVLYAGPLRVEVRDPSLDPDTGTDRETARVLSATGTGPVRLSAPFLQLLLSPHTHRSSLDVDRELPPGASADEIVAAATEELTAARAYSLHAAAEDQWQEECMVCGTTLPALHLLCPSTSEQLLTCPACAFDSDTTVYAADPTGLAYQIDELLDTDLAAPATWAAVVTLLVAGTATGLHDRLAEAQRGARAAVRPSERWSGLDAQWVWLAQPEQRPAWQAPLGPVARPDALVAAVHAAHPELRALFVDELRAAYLDQLDEDDHPGRSPEPAVLDLGWLVAVTYATALHTDTVDHPERRDPWHALTSFEALEDQLRELEKAEDVDDLLIIAMIEAGVSVLRAHDTLPMP